MTEKELKGFSKKDLIKIIIGNSDRSIKTEADLAEERTRVTELKRNITELESEIISLKKENEEKAMVSVPGTLADAALKISGFYEAADKAAGAYLERVMLLTRQTEKENAVNQRKAMEKAAALVSEAEEKAAQIISEAERCAAERMAQADEYCAQVSEKVADFYKSREMIEEICDKNGVKP